MKGTTDTDGEGTPDYIDPDSDDPSDNTVGSADGNDDDIDEAGNTSLDANGDGLMDNPIDADDDGVADVIDEDNTMFGGLGTPEPLTIDLLPNFTFSSQTFTINESKEVVININEIQGDATNGQIQFFVPNSTGFTYTFDPTKTSATVFTSIAVNNADWTVTTTPTGLLFSSDVMISGNQNSKIALTITAGNTPGAKANLTVNIVPNTGGEVQPFNNNAVLGQSIQN